MYLINVKKNFKLSLLFILRLLKYPLTEQSNCSTIEINSVDYSCLKEGEFLNDNIISFYLK